MAGCAIKQYQNVNNLATNSGEDEIQTLPVKHLNITAELLQNVLYGKLTLTSSALKLCPYFPGLFPDFYESIFIHRPVCV